MRGYAKRYSLFLYTSGINGGTRLFVAGNQSKPNLVYWSDANNPLYFSENNYAYIGDSGQAVTAFGKQGDMLVIFKERELYYATYVAGDSFTAQDVIDGKILDVSAHLAKFPITQINAGIGCDCPNTVQLCNNRLIWTASDGKVYGLMAASQTSERNVRELSALVDKRLSAYSAGELRNAVSGDFNSHYLLAVGREVYLLDYMDSGFQYYASYYDDRKAQRNMPWTIWRLPEELEWSAMTARGARIWMMGLRKRTWPNSLGFDNAFLSGVSYTFDGSVDCHLSWDDSSLSYLVSQTPILSRFQTKVFDFGQPERRKKIRRLHIGATDPAGDAISLSYVTEQEVREDALRLGAYGTGEMREWCVTPGVNRVRQFGIRAESKGAMAVDNMTLKYEVNGEVR